MKAHLILLRAFHSLREDFGEDAFAEACRSAAVSYDLWARGLSSPDPPGESPEGNVDKEGEVGKDTARGTNLVLPSLPVLMAWHTHMLNPRVYHSDCETAYRGLQCRAFPLERVVCHVYDIEARLLAASYSFCF